MAGQAHARPPPAVDDARTFSREVGPLARSHLKHGRKGGRFDPVLIARRLEQLRALADVPPKEIGAVVFSNQTPENAARSWYKRAFQFSQPFQLGEIEIAVDHLVKEARRKGLMPGDAKYLPGFPFIDLWDSVSLERRGSDPQ